MILTALLVAEVMADKVPAVDLVNDVVQTVVRPAADGIACGAGSGSQSGLLVIWFRLCRRLVAARRIGRLGMRARPPYGNVVPYGAASAPYDRT